MTAAHQVDLEIGPFDDPADAADRLTDVDHGDAWVAFGANLETGMVGVTAQVGADNPNDAALQVMFWLGQQVFRAGFDDPALVPTVRGSSRVPVLD